MQPKMNDKVEFRLRCAEVAASALSGNFEYVLSNGAETVDKSQQELGDAVLRLARRIEAYATEPRPMVPDEVK